MNATRFSCLAANVYNVDLVHFPEYEKSEQLCIWINQVAPYIEIIQHQIIFIPLVMICMISLFGNIKEVYKWIIFHFR